MVPLKRNLSFQPKPASKIQKITTDYIPPPPSPTRVPTLLPEQAINFIISTNN